MEVRNQSRDKNKHAELNIKMKCIHWIENLKASEAESKKTKTSAQTSARENLFEVNQYANYFIKL